jgi:DNA-binding transcriptional LysR family regulator
METKFLETFVLVAETGSMAEAARRQDLTPAAVAQQLRALEREVGAPLVARSGRTVLPTAAGYRLLDHATPVLRGVGNLYAVVQDDVVAGELRLGAINSALYTSLPRILGRLARAHPDVTVFIQSGVTHELYEALQADTIDAAVCLHPDFALSKALVWHQVREAPLVVLAPPAMAHQDPLELLRTQPLLRYDRTLGGGRKADRFLRHHGVVPRERFELSSLQAIAMMVSEGLGVSLVPDIDSPLIGGLNVTRLPVQDLEEPWRYGVLWRRGGARSRLVAAFVEQVQAHQRAA